MEEVRGKFIVLEGADCTGKSTIATLLSEWLAKEGIQNELTHHPGATPIGAELRKIVKSSDFTIPPITEGMIMGADNAAFIELVLKPALEAGTWVVGDRNNFVSSMAYQLESGASLDELTAIHDATCQNPPKIDLLFILRASDDDRQRRKSLKSGAPQHFNEDGKHDRFEDRGGDYTAGIVRAYERLMEEQSDTLLKFVKPTTELKDPTPRCFYIDASQSVGTVLDNITETIKTLLLEEPAKQTSE